MKDIVERIINGDQRALARGITIVENHQEGHCNLMSRLYTFARKAHVVGITGSPGAGKSSLVNALISEWRKRGKTVAVCAIDPTSPFSGGALLGDRVRMRDHEEDDGVFIRSMGTRGSLGGLSEACQDVVHLMDAAGFDVVIVETVGVGQSELDIMKTADTVALVLYPSGGDVIQAFKAGIMEIADIFIINKADLPGLTQLRGEIQDLLHLTERREAWEPPIVETIATEKKGTDQVVDELIHHYNYLTSSGRKTERRLSQQREELMRRLKEKFSEDITPIVEETLSKIQRDMDEKMKSANVETEITHLKKLRDNQEKITKANEDTTEAVLSEKQRDRQEGAALQFDPYEMADEIFHKWLKTKWREWGEEEG